MPDLYPADGPLPPLPTGIEYGVPMTYTSSEQVGHLAPGVVCYAVAPMMAAMFEDTGQTYVKVAGGLSAKPWRSAMLVHASAVEKVHACHVHFALGSERLLKPSSRAPCPPPHTVC